MKKKKKHSTWLHCLAAVTCLLLFVSNTSAATVAQMVSGDSHSLVIMTDGTLWAWGANYEGELGDGTYETRQTPVQIGTDTDWQTIAAGGYISYALKNDGTLWGWGDNWSSQLGESVGATQNVPVQIGTDHWRKISANDHTLAIRDDGTLWAWGYNSYGQVGNGTFGNYQLNPMQIGTDTDWQTVSAGGRHSLAIKEDGGLWAWGDNSYGELGTGVRYADQYTPTRIGTDTDWQTLTTRWRLSMAIKSNGTLWVWGENRYYALGDPAFDDPQLSPVQLGTDSSWQTVSAGGQGAVATKTDGTLWAWGRNDYGQVGNGTQVDQPTPVQITTDSNWQTAYRFWYSLGLKTDGTLWMWGDEPYAATANYFDVPTLVVFPDPAPASPLHISNSSLRFECIYCHPDGVGRTLPVTVCLDCHKNSSGGNYTGFNTIEMATHSSVVIGSNSYGSWEQQCGDCHDPHENNGVSTYDGVSDASYVLGEFTADNGVSDPATNTTTFSVTDLTIYDPAWADPATWGEKTSSERGLLFVMYNPVVDKYYWHEIVSATDTSITINFANYVPVPRFNPDPIPVQLIYGMRIENEINQTSVKYSGPKSMADDDSGTGFDGTPDGICQVCHTQTLYWRSDGSLADHYSGQNCVTCHPHEEGFK